MKVIRLNGNVGRDIKVLLLSGCVACEDSIVDSMTEGYSVSPKRRVVSIKMDYNQLKIRVLGLLGSGELASEEVRTHLHQAQIELSDKAVKMALMRYTRQGLLSRSKKKGHYHYTLTEKGLARREWLSKTR